MKMPSTFSAGLRETNAVFLVMFAILLLVFHIGIFNSCGTLLSNLCTISIGITPLGRKTCSFFHIYDLYLHLVVF